MKHLIVCCDGTWNTPDQESNGAPSPTNVVKLRNYFAERAPADDGPIEQRVYYHPGVRINPERRLRSSMHATRQAGYRRSGRSAQQVVRVDLPRLSVVLVSDAR